jgi:hypothetical protein
LNKKTIVKVYGIFTLILFLCSVVYPFLQVQLFGIVTFTGAPGPETFWSFKVTTIWFRTPDNPGPPIIREYWFADYWTQYTSYRTVELGFGIGPILAFMLGAQVLTVLFAALAISKVKPYLFISSAIFNVCIIVFMWLTSRAFAYSYYRCSFQAGFWLAAASATLFFAGSVLPWNRISIPYPKN